MRYSSLFASTLVTLSLLFFFIPTTYAATDLDPMTQGAKGDGIADDTEPLQKALTICSNSGITCKISAGKNFLVTKPLYMWGNANLTGVDGSGSITFNVNSPYLLNIGISGHNQLKPPYTGTISQLKFNVIGGTEGRIIFFWRTDGATITSNVFDVGLQRYSATSSGNDYKWLLDGPMHYIRKNIIISNNEIIATAKDLGSEGIGLGNFDGATIENNRVTGVGDDPIGVHFCKNVKVLRNNLASVDGRLYVSNSTNVEVAYNKLERMASLADNKFYPGIALLYVGFETLDANEFAAPDNINIHDNELHYPENSIDAGAAIYLYGSRHTTVANNHITNDSSLSSATAVHILPARFDGPWKDSSKIDPSNTARVWDINLLSNTSDGKIPLKMVMTGTCSEYKGNIVVQDNIAEDFQFYCGNVSLRTNTSLNRKPEPPSKVNVKP